MKQIFVMAVATAALVLSSCSTSKKPVVTNAPQWTTQQPTQAAKPSKIKIEEEISECERLSWDVSDGKLKAYASAIDGDRDFARQQATTLARGELASEIKALVTNVMKIYRGSTTRNGVGTSSRNAEQTVDLIAEECMANTAVVCSKRYVVNNGYEYEVCVAMIGTIEDAAKKAVLSEDSALKVKFDEQKFRESYQEELARYRQQKEANR